MDEQGKAQIQAIGAGLLGFGLVVGLGSYFVVPRGAVSSGSISRAQGPLFAPAPHRTIPLTATAASAPAASPAPLLSDEFRGEANAAASASPSTAAGAVVAASGASAVAAGTAGGASAQPSPRLIATAPLGTSGAAAAASGAGGVAAAGKASGTAAASASAARGAKTAVASNRTVASAVVHYGVSDRSQLMERGAGPVYNFGSLGEKNDPIAGAMRQVDAAQQQINASSASAADKATLQQNVSQFHDAAVQADAAVQQATVQAGAPAAR